MDIAEEIDPRLIDAWKCFDNKARQLSLKYSVEADEPLRQSYAVPTGQEKETVSSSGGVTWKGLADYMYTAPCIKDGSVLLTVDPGHKKNFVIFQFTLAALNDSQENILKHTPHVTIHQKLGNSTNQNRLDKILSDIIDGTEN